MDSIDANRIAAALENIQTILDVTTRKLFQVVVRGYDKKSPIRVLLIDLRAIESVKYDCETAGNISLLMRMRSGHTIITRDLQEIIPLCNALGLGRDWAKGQVSSYDTI